MPKKGMPKLHFRHFFSQAFPDFALSCSSFKKFNASKGVIREISAWTNSVMSLFSILPKRSSCTGPLAVDLSPLIKPCDPLELRVPSGRITQILNGKRGISAETALRLARYFGNSAQFWVNLQSRYDLALVEQNIGAKIFAEVKQAAG
jgi:hypothetical protein